VAAYELNMDDAWFEEELVPRVNRVVMKAAVAVRDDAKAGCPVDTGDLKASLTAINVRPMVGRIISHLPYFPAVELGFHGEEYVHPHMRRGHPVRGFSRVGNTPAEPFARPALWRVRDLSED
jgi:hypothetical protein